MRRSDAPSRLSEKSVARAFQPAVWRTRKSALRPLRQPARVEKQDGVATIGVCFLSGLAFFSMGLAVGLESRRASALAFGHHLLWLSAFGLLQSAVEWMDLFILLDREGALHNSLLIARAVCLPLSALLLVRFGIGLVNEAGELPDWLTLIPVLFLVPLALLIGYALIVVSTASPLVTAADVWSRYLLYFPGCLLTSLGFMRQWYGVPPGRLRQARRLLLGAALAFLLNAIVAGLIVPPMPDSVPPSIASATGAHDIGLPAQIGRMLAAVAMTFFVVRALGIFEVEREQEMVDLRKKRARAQQATVEAHAQARQIAEDWTNGLVSTSRRIANMENVDDVLRAIVELARRLLNADVAALGLWSAAGAHLQIKCYATESGAVAVDSSIVASSLVLGVVRECRACLYPQDTDAAVESAICPVLNRAIRAAAIVALQLDGRSIGGIWVVRFTEQLFAPIDLAGLERLADQAVIAIEHALMTERIQSVAVIEERSRIAREMHDGLAQILGYLGVEIQTLEALARRGDANAILSQLRLARERIDDAQAEVRENIASMHTTLSNSTGFVPALEQYLEEFGVQTNLAVQMINKMEGALRLSPLAEVQLVCIIHEALANVRKHARARQVQVGLSREDNQLCVTIADDGIGLNLGATVNRFGLQTMRERAASVGGALTIDSQPNHGTLVQVRLPLLVR